MRILFAEDDSALNDAVKKQLENQSFSVDSCSTGSDALDFALYTDYDAIILDIMMPEKDGIEVLRELRKSGKETPVLLLTALDSVSYRVLGLDSGADDYLVKPFDFKELLARIRVMIRRNTHERSNRLFIDDLVMDCAQHTVARGGVPIILTNKEFAVLECLLRNKGVILSKEQIEQHVCDYSYEAETNVIKVYIRYLRKKIDDGHERKLIHTVRGFGYVIRLDGEGEK
ncbi:MAG: response regulator transcription factor [Ruminococcus sp.]|nr:response regulator transcription factor [Ruminococcus sp.]